MYVQRSVALWKVTLGSSLRPVDWRRGHEPCQCGGRAAAFSAHSSVVEIVIGAGLCPSREPALIQLLSQSDIGRRFNVESLTMNESCLS
jgi:hypothetical protein